MRPTTLLSPLILTMLLHSVCGAADDLRSISALMSNPESCERRVLLDYLRHDDVRVRSAALDLLEMVTGRDFGLDPWLPPAEVPQTVQQELTEWATAEELIGELVKAPEPAQLADTVVLLRTADPDTQRRICQRFEPWKSALVSTLLAELKSNQHLSEKESDNLRCALYRIQLLTAMPSEAGRIAPLLASHARKDILTGLEALRKCGKDALPVLMDFTASPDSMVREVAIDVLLQTGQSQAYKILMPKLMAEQDRNILQIAARRAPDCAPLPQIITFLNHCAAQQDEDVAVAALEALADMETDDDDDDKPTEKLAGTEQAMSMDTCLALLTSPNWRVRAAMLRALQSGESFMPSIRDKKLQQAVLAAMKDDDETVALHAMQVLHKRNLAASFTAELSDFAVRTPAAAPYIIYLFGQQKAEMSPALIESVSRLTPEQVDMLIHYESEYATVYNTTNRLSNAVETVLTSLLANPDPRVRHKVMSAWGTSLYCQRKEWAELFVDWLQDSTLPGQDKIDSLRSLLFRYSEKGRRRGCDDRLVAWLQQEVENPTQKNEQLQQVIYAGLLNLNPALVTTIDGARLQQMSPALLNSLIEERPELILSLEREFAGKFLAHEDFNSFHELMTAGRDRAAIREYLSSIELNDEFWERLIIEEIDTTRYEGPPSGIIQRALQATAQPPDFRTLHTVYLLLYHKPSMAPEQVSDIIAAAPEPQRIALECLRKAPQTAEAVEPWAKQYHNSPHIAVRRAVAGCLLPMDGWLFYLPRTGNLPPYSTTRERKLLDNDIRRASCPVSLIRLVQAMQTDPDPIVSLTACCSMLYRTGDCDRPRLRELLTHFASLRKQFPDEEEGTPKLQADMQRSDYAAINETVTSVWYRWHEYRTGTTEFFKLKGSPKKLRSGLETLLAEIAETTEHSPWGLIEEVKNKLPAANASSSRRGMSVQPHEFDYPTAQVNTAPTTPAPLPEQEIESDTDEPEESAQPPVADSIPVRIEFFHKKGCDVCQRVQKQLDTLKSDFPGLEVVSFDVESETGRERNTVLSARFDVPRSERRKAPAIFAEGGCLLGDAAANPNKLQRLLRDSLAGSGQSTRLADNPEPTQQQQDTATPEPVGDTPLPTIAPTAPATQQSPSPERLAAATATETAAAAGEQLWEHLRSYGVLAIGALVALLGGCLVLFGRSKEES